MATGRTHPLIQHLRRAVARPDEAGSSDRQLLSRYLATRDEAAFEAIVRRHGPMVLGVCRRLLHDRHEVHDAFQATFLVLVRKAASVAPPEMLPNWLHGVARQTAVRARSSAARRRLRERLVAVVPEPEARPAEPCDGLRPLLDEELSRLPGNQRVAVILCLLEGKTHAEAARHLGWPVGTLASRLSRGRRVLAKRLARRGLAPSAGVLAALAAPGTAAVPPARVLSTVQIGSLYGAGPASGAVPARVVALTEGVLKAMSLKKLKAVAAVLLTAGLVALGGGLLTRTRAADDRPAVQVKDKRPSPAPAASPAPGKSKSRLEVRADGKQVRVRAVFGDEEIKAVAGGMSYDEQANLLVLEGDVTVHRRRGKEAEEVQCTKMVIDRKAGTVKVEGATGIRFNTPALGPVPIALDTGFPVAKAEREQLFNFWVGFFDSGTVAPAPPANPRPPR